MSGRFDDEALYLTPSEERQVEKLLAADYERRFAPTPASIASFQTWLADRRRRRQ